uniref:Glycosyl transferase CAP10 domain-containing protein n=1 Tax=Quercus lobata TaxID=97700 RepID=A0A7N2MHR4_QUELO
MGWMAREPYAYWKGNPSVALIKQELMKCNVSDNQDWNASVYAQVATSITRPYVPYTPMYKIYIEGSAWSVSEKYILACDSVSSLVKPHYYDFFTRGLMPVHHCWLVRNDDKCKSIKFTVDWGNSHKQKVLTFKLIRPRKAVELCAETMACPAEGVQKKFFMESMENGPTYTSPCTMPHPYDPPSLQAFLQREEISIKQVEL